VSRVEIYEYKGGIREYVAYLNRDKQPLHEEIIYVQGNATMSKLRWHCSGVLMPTLILYWASRIISAQLMAVLTWKG